MQGEFERVSEWVRAPYRDLGTSVYHVIRTCPCYDARAGTHVPSARSETSVRNARA